METSLGEADFGLNMWLLDYSRELVFFRSFLNESCFMHDCVHDTPWSTQMGVQNFGGCRNDCSEASLWLLKASIDEIQHPGSL